MGKEILLLFNNRRQDMRVVSYILVAQLCNLQPSYKNFARIRAENRLNSMPEIWSFQENFVTLCWI